MKKTVFTLLAVGLVAVGAYYLFTFYDNRFPYGRMWETVAIRPHEEEIPPMAQGSVPFYGGEMEYRLMDGKEIPSPLSSNELLDARKTGDGLYVKYCIQCHGKNYDGNGTVGQSFAPLPGDLRSAKVQEMSDGLMFKEISYGIPGGRQPALAGTIALEDRWRIIAYVKSLGKRM